VRPRILAYVSFVALLLALAASGCRAPGEPPSHPGQGEYQDLIRREIDAAGSALATCVIVLRYMDQGDVPRAYGKVVIRQAANDLRKVAQDLDEITPPARARRAQRAFREITVRAQQRLDDLGRQLGDAAARRRARAAFSSASNTLDQRLKSTLDPT
jgi:ElaB/YqjD/DUF883 family membrane-anchored ribosome-binding protein